MDRVGRSGPGTLTLALYCRLGMLMAHVSGLGWSDVVGDIKSIVPESLLLLSIHGNDGYSRKKIVSRCNRFPRPCRVTFRTLSCVLQAGLSWVTTSRSPESTSVLKLRSLSFSEDVLRRTDELGSMDTLGCGTNLVCGLLGFDIWRLPFRDLVGQL